MDKSVIIDGIRQFVANAEATLRQASDVLFEIKFEDEDERYTAFIGIEGDDPLFVLSYQTVCAALSGTSAASTLLLRNWGGVQSTCFYYSVHVEDDRRPWLYLETRQLLEPGVTSDGIASLLGNWSLQCSMAREATR